MAEWTIIALVLCTAISYAINGGLLNPVTSTLAIFLGVAFLANLHLYGLYEFSDIAYQIVLLGCVSLLAGAALSRVNHLALMRKAHVVARRRSADWIISYGLLNLLLLVTIAVILATRHDLLQTLASGGGIREVHDSYLGYGATTFVESAGALLGRVIVTPVLFAALPVFVYGLIRGQSNRRFNFLFGSAMILNIATSGGRIILLYGAVQILVLLALGGRLRVRMSRGRAVLVMVGLVLVVVLVTLWRGNTIGYEAYTYFAIPMPLLAHWVTALDTQGVTTGGSSFAYGVLTLFSNAANLVGGSLDNSAVAVVNQPQDQWVALVPGHPFNAFVTMYYYFYADFRIPGVAFLSAAYGFVIQSVYNWVRVFGGVRPTLVLLLTMQSVVMSFVRWEPTDGAFVLAFVVLFLAVRKDRTQGSLPAGSPPTGSLVSTGRGVAGD